MINYKERNEFDSITAAYEKCHRYAEGQLFGRAATGAAFSLENNWGWKDKTEVDHTTKGPAMPLLGGTTPMVDGDDDDGTQTDDQLAEDPAAS